MSWMQFVCHAGYGTLGRLAVGQAQAINCCITPSMFAANRRRGLLLFYLVLKMLAVLPDVNITCLFEILSATHVPGVLSGAILLTV